MCYLARQHHRAPLEDIERTPPSTIPQVRPRWVGAAVATIVGGVALAAFLAPPVPPASADEASTGAPPVIAKDSLTPTAERLSLPADDGVPAAAPEVAMAAGRECSHGL